MATATTVWRARGTGFAPQRRLLWLFGLAVWCLCAGVCVAVETNTASDGPPAQANSYPSEVQTKFREAQKRFQEEPRAAEAAWQFSRACFDMVECVSEKEERAHFAQKGIAAGEKAVSLAPDSPPAHYYLGMNLGQLARTRGISALKIIKQMSHEFEKARQLDPKIDYGGPDRNLGLLRRDAPVILGLGNRKEARNHLARAVELAPDYPDNRLCLIEGYLKWGEEDAAARELKNLKECWAKARSKYTGSAWARAWIDWENQLERIEKKLERRD